MFCKNPSYLPVLFAVFASDLSIQYPGRNGPPSTTRTSRTRSGLPPAPSASSRRTWCSRWGNCKDRRQPDGEVGEWTCFQGRVKYHICCISYPLRMILSEVKLLSVRQILQHFSVILSYYKCCSIRLTESNLTSVKLRSRSKATFQRHPFLIRFLIIWNISSWLSLVSFSMKYLRNMLLSSTRKLQMTWYQG